MDLDPKLMALAGACIGPSKFLVDIVVLSSPRRLPTWTKPAAAYLSGLALMLLYDLYIGGIHPNSPPGREAAGLMLAAFETMMGAILLTEAQKRVDRKKDS
jgi:hypothetical protein